MYHKVRSTLYGLSFVAAFMVGGMFMAQPLPAQQPDPNVARVEAALALAQAVLAMVAAEQAAEFAATQAEREAQRITDTKARSARLKLELGMPFYSFGALRARRRES